VANRLARETSPYLLLHAENPVDWYPWGEEAFEAARREDKPLFLSVGYSTCHWCHVMERESFSDPEIARQLNEGFVCVKVDREERPDVDDVYMTATQLLTRSGGWPNSVFLTPDLKPFFAGTYFPPRDGLGRPGFPRVLEGLREAWLLRRAEVLQQAEVVAGAMESHLAGPERSSARLPGAEIGAATQAALAARFDPEWGGFSPAPKFPSPANLFFLLDRASDRQARDMLVTTLDRMARGGIRDQLGGGFHRYSTDETWLVPHFEKMLYDNAALGRLYAEAAPLAPGAGFEDVARATLDFVLRELAHPDGGFLSAIDADSDGHEGLFYTFTQSDLDEALPADDRDLFRVSYGLEGPPPFEGERYVLHVPLPLAEQASEAGLAVEELRRRLEPGRRALLGARDRRTRPLIDDKVLTDWNGLMIGALARAGACLDEQRYVDAARRAAAFILARLVEPDTGRLLHAFRGGRAQVSALLDDYAFLVEGLLELHAATGDDRFRTEAVRLVREQEEWLGEGTGGAYFAAAADSHLPFRSRPAHDGAVASGTGVSALNLLDVARLDNEGGWVERAESLLRAFGDEVVAAPLAHVTLVRALVRLAERPASSRPAPPAAQASAASSAAELLEDEAREAVEVEGRLGPGIAEGWKPFSVELEIRRGFHLNAGEASSPSGVTTRVRPVLGRLRALRYPPGVNSGPDAPPLYRGRVRIEGEIEHVGAGAPAIELAYQACDETRCLPLVTRLVRLR
jgi:hypothetical protein